MPLIVVLFLYAIVVVLLCLAGYQSFRTFWYGEEASVEIAYVVFACGVAGFFLKDYPLIWACGTIVVFIAVFRMLRYFGFVN